MKRRIFLLPLLLQLASLSCDAQLQQTRYSYVSIQKIAVGKTPTSVAIADVNLDEKPDIIVANGDDNTVSVLLGDGTGKFAEAKGSPFSAGNSPNDICVFDLNGDGRPDLVFANHDAKYLTVLLGDGHGAFRPAPGSPVTVLSRPHTHGVSVGEFNGDGKPDLVTDSWGENKVTVVFGDGRGGFSSPGVQFGVGKRPYEKVRVADLNGDGHADIITTNLDGDNITVLLGDGKGGFAEAPGSPFPAGKTPFGLAIADLNGDGKFDLAVVNYSGHADQPANDGVTILIGDGKAGFRIMAGSPFPTGHAPAGIAVGDVNGDGIPDVVTNNLASNDVSVLLGGKGTFRPTPPIAVGNKPYGVAVADLNGDGKADIVVANSADNTISVILSK
jgi:hypothetical protein